MCRSLDILAETPIMTIYGAGFSYNPLSIMQHLLSLNQDLRTYPDDILNLLFVRRSILSKEVVGVGLSRRIRVRIV